MPSNKFQPLSPATHPRFSGITTFSRLPLIEKPGKNELDIAILGVPTDAGTSYRPGSRFGPRGLRDASVLCRNYNPSISVGIYEKLNIADVGDVSVNPMSLKKTLEAISTKTKELKKTGAKIIALGGDHSILTPILTETVAHEGEITLVHFDAHTDTGDESWGEKFHHGTPIRRLIENKSLNPKKIFQIGIRGPLGDKEQLEWTLDQGVNILGMDDFYTGGTRDKFFDKIRKTAGKGKIYISFDIDGVDPAFAPGTGTPVVGGLTSNDALQAVRALKGLNLIGADLVEVAPAYDHAEITSLLGAALVF